MAGTPLVLSRALPSAITVRAEGVVAPVPTTPVAAPPEPAGAVIEMGRALRPGASAGQVALWFEQNPDFARTLRKFAPRIAGPEEALKQAQRAVRHELTNGGKLPKGLRVGNDVRATAAAYARDLGLAEVEVSDGVVSAISVSGVRSPLTALNPSDAPRAQLLAIGKALNSLRFGLDRVEPAPIVIEPQAKAYSVPNAHRMSHLSLLAYQDEATVRAQLGAWGYDLSTFSWLSNTATDTQGFTVADAQGNAFCIFRGTESLRDAKTDADITLVPTRWKRGQERVHRGFRNALESVWPQVVAGLAKARPAGAATPLFWGGHSLGAALGQIGALRAVQTGVVPASSTQVYTLGSPRLGDDELRWSYNSTLPRSFRTANYQDGRFAQVQDLVTQIAPLALGYRAVGQLVRLSEGGLVEVIPANDPRARAAPPAGSSAMPGGTSDDPGTPELEALRGEALKRYIEQATRPAAPTPVGPGSKGLALPSLSFHKSSTYLERTGETLQATLARQR
jgi:triacylglycerol lipase